MLDAKVIDAFVQALEKVFVTMLQTEVQVREPVLRGNDDPGHDVSAIIGLSGDMVGSVVLGFPVAVAERLASLFCGEAMTARSEDFGDAIGEIVNIVSGNAKAAFPNHKTTISCPTVVIGNGHQVLGRGNVSCLMLPCSCDCGDFMLEIALRDMVAENQGLAGHAALSA